ncbi:hypothetical protein E3N88_38538 [Mikania micrantha]|uniref:Peptidase M50 domain-containing protein n=1 Tax=Mikania micrantha TaxID=192012 RepID=A0A5N6LUC1_9ASTR|nr:hypothetical protein E3N88_38538 [Mikania micrantha]
MSSATTITSPACFRRNFLPLSQCSSCCDLRFHPFVSSYVNHDQRRKIHPPKCVSRLVVTGNRVVKCKANETETGPSDDDDKEREVHESVEIAESTSSSSSITGDEDNGKDKGQPSQLELLNKFLDSTKAQELNEDKDQSSQLEVLNRLLNKDDVEAKPKEVIVEADDIEIASGSPLPSVKPQQLEDIIMIPKETIDILKEQVFGFDTFFITSQEPYEAGVLFKGNLRGSAAESYKKIEKRLHETFGDQYKLFLLINPEDDKPVAVVVPRKTLQPETTAVPEWFAAGSFGLVTIFTLLLRNVPALQSNLLSVVDNIDLLKDGLSGALVTALSLGVHEISHILVARSAGVKLGVPFFVPSWQIGSFGAITRILNIVPNRQELLKIAAAGPLAGFSLGLVLLLLGFYLPPTDGIGIVVDASVFHESFLAGGIAKLLLGDVLKEGTTLSVNPLVIWAWAGLLINAINSIPAGELDGGRISFAIWGRKILANRVDPFMG